MKVVIPPGSGSSSNGPYPESLVGTASGRLYFATNFYDGSAVLWLSDGTEAGTVPVKSFPASTASIPSLLVLLSIGERPYFVFNDPGTTGLELWTSDGTHSGTHIVKDLTPGPGGAWPPILIPQGGQLTIFHEGAPTPAGPQVDLWRTNGTDPGTIQFKSIGPPATLGPISFGMGETQYFFISRPGQSLELWRSDGTTDGTVLVKALGTLGTLGIRSLRLQTDSLFYFVLTTPTQGNILWRTDGTEDGTFALKSISPPETLREELFPAGDVVLFVVTSASQGTMLWRTDGTVNGTYLAKRLDAQVVAFENWVREGNLALFVLLDGPNAEVWKSDGTSAGTVRLDTFGHYVSLMGVQNSNVLLFSTISQTEKSRIERLSLSGGGKSTVKIIPNPYANEPWANPYLSWVANIHGKLYFTLNIGGTGPVGREASLWVTDGTSAGTLLLTNGLSLVDEYVPPYVPLGADTLLFVAGPITTGPELWCTRGTPATTRMLQEIQPGIRGSIPSDFRFVGDRLYFRAYDETQSFQLWSMPANLTCPPPGEAQQGR
ncbi:hypothetical protein [Myxococcus stipitatus]|uniref:hypothetical protein n=1 Tax=Myxococcus stipitatus TaxID=83455 RepID=UPI0030CDFB1D